MTTSRRFAIVLLFVFLISFVGVSARAQLKLNKQGSVPTIKTPISLYVKYACGEDYMFINKGALSRHYRQFYNNEFTDWYVCGLNDNVKNHVGLDCPSEWDGPRYHDLYAYTCFVYHSTADVPNAPRSRIEGCGAGYKHDGVITIAAPETVPGHEELGPLDHYSWIECEKQGKRLPSSPCILGYNPHILLDLYDGYVICGK